MKKEVKYKGKLVALIEVKLNHLAKNEINGDRYHYAIVSEEYSSYIKTYEIDPKYNLGAILIGLEEDIIAAFKMSENVTNLFLFKTLLRQEEFLKMNEKVSEKLLKDFGYTD